MTTRYERMKMQRRMQRRIRLVVEERRMARARPPEGNEPDPTPELPRQAAGRLPVEGG